MARVRYENLVLAGTSTGDTTAYSVGMYNGALLGVFITTGGVGSSGTTAWKGSSTATTNSSGMSSTAFIAISGERWALPMISVAPPAAGGAGYYPFTGGHTSSGGLVNGYSTGPFFGFRFPLADERIVVQTSGFATGQSNGYCHTLKFMIEGA